MLIKAVFSLMCGGVIRTGRNEAITTHQFCHCNAMWPMMTSILKKNEQCFGKILLENAVDELCVNM